METKPGDQAAAIEAGQDTPLAALAPEQRAAVVALVKEIDLRDSVVKSMISGS